MVKIKIQYRTEAEVLAALGVRGAGLEVIRASSTAALVDYVGGFSKPSKMPWLSFNLSALRCKIGSRLAKIEGTVCADCYALAGFYAMRDAQAAAERRLAAMSRPFWAEACAEALNRKAAKIAPRNRFFRWFDSGDIQSPAMLAQLVRVAELCPGIAFWLPSKEYGIAVDYAASNAIPDNLCIRLSAYRKNVSGPVALAMRHGLTVSEVITSAELASPGSFVCPSSMQGNKCLACRACWLKSNVQTGYVYHEQTGKVLTLENAPLASLRALEIAA